MNHETAAWPSYTEEEVEAVARVLRESRGNYWTGEEGTSFEREFAAAMDCQYALTVANGTLALELALQAVGIGEGDEVVVPPRTFIASVSAIVMAGARPVFADIDPDTQTITADSVAAVLSSRTRAVMCVHLAGCPCDMDALVDVATPRGLALIEDCAQAHGATYEGRPVGGLGDVAAWSFCQDKIMSTGGEGGMVTTNDPAIRDAVWSRRDHGKSRRAVQAPNPGTGFRWVHAGFGTNARLTEMQSAMGRIQLRRLSHEVERRRRNAAILADCLQSLPGIRVPATPFDAGHARYRFYAFVREQDLAPGWGRDRILEVAQERGLPCREGICPEVYREQALRDTGLVPPQSLPVAQSLGRTSLSLPVHPTLAEGEVRALGEGLAGVIREAVA